MESNITTLRSLMKKSGIDAYIIPSTDEFNNEYVPEAYKRLCWLTGFTGSNGIAIITSKKLYLYTDGRYLLQAKKELDNNFEIRELGKIAYDIIHAERVGYDPMIHTYSSIDSIKKYFHSESQFISIEGNLIDEIWTDRSNLPSGKYYQYDENYQYRAKKVLNAMHKDADFMLISSAEQLCWLSGIRGDDVMYSPIALYYGILSKNGVLEKINSIDALKKRLLSIQDKKIELDLLQTSKGIADLVKNKISKTNPINSIRVTKTKKEIDTMMEAHLYDGIAMCRFLHWLSRMNSIYDEFQISEKLLYFRSDIPSFYSPSFSTISAFKENGAVIHYVPSKNNSKLVRGDGLLLIDSGGQYKCGGTTDVTRVLPIGKISEEWIYHYTLVLKSHIELSSCEFPIGTTGAQLDGVARAPLWRNGLDYAHGTGHGVGVFLSVHEGDLRISKICNIAVPESAVLSNEPGVYFEGKWGIRLENLMISRESSKKGFLKFIPITLVPFDKRLIDISMLSRNQIKWLNAYHKSVEKAVRPHVDLDVASWLESSCAEI